MTNEDKLFLKYDPWHSQNLNDCVFEYGVDQSIAITKEIRVLVSMNGRSNKAFLNLLNFCQ